MRSKQWRRRINLAKKAESEGQPSLLQELCDELEKLTEPEKLEAVPVKQEPVKDFWIET